MVIINDLITVSLPRRLKRSTTEGAAPSGSSLGEDGGEDSPGPMSAPLEERDPLVHGHLNPLAWENLPPPVRDQLEEPKHPGM